MRLCVGCGDLSSLHPAGIREEIKEIEDGMYNKDANVLKVYIYHMCMTALCV